MQSQDLDTFVIREAMIAAYAALNDTTLHGMYLSGASGQGKSFILYLMALVSYAEKKFTLYIVGTLIVKLMAK
ncbi:MAG: hypothetical protein ACYCUI_16600 [Vulcanimicrobiaceae bacterium]